MDPVWSHLLFALLSVLLIAANVDSVRRVRGVGETSRTLLINELLGTALVAFIVALPWILGGIDPSREDLTWSIILSFAVGLLSVSAIVLSAFDLARLDRSD
jgi:ABC-type microcin C transport system permease subunit YejE